MQSENRKGLEKQINDIYILPILAKIFSLSNASILLYIVLE